MFICTKCKGGRNKQKKGLQGSFLALKNDKSLCFAEDLSIRQVGTYTSVKIGIQPLIWFTVNRGLLSNYNLNCNFLFKGSGSKQVYEPGTVLKRIKVGLILPPIEFYGSLIINFSERRIRPIMSVCENRIIR